MPLSESRNVADRPADLHLLDFAQNGAEDWRYRRTELRQELGERVEVDVRVPPENFPELAQELISPHVLEDLVGGGLEFTRGRLLGVGDATEAIHQLACLLHVPRHEGLLDEATDAPRDLEELGRDLLRAEQDAEDFQNPFSRRERVLDRREHADVMSLDLGEVGHHGQGLVRDRPTVLGQVPVIGSALRGLARIRLPLPDHSRRPRKPIVGRAREIFPAGPGFRVPLFERHALVTDVSEVFLPKERDHVLRVLVAAAGGAHQDVHQGPQLIGLQTTSNRDFAQPVPEERDGEGAALLGAVVDALALEEETELLDPNGEITELIEAGLSRLFEIGAHLEERGIVSRVRSARLDRAHQGVDPARDARRIGRGDEIARYIGSRGGWTPGLTHIPGNIGKAAGNFILGARPWAV